MKPRIVHLLSSFGMGGQERVAFDLATSQLRAGCWVAALSMAPPPDGPLAAEFRAAGAVVDRVARPRPGVDRMSSAWLIRRFIDPDATSQLGPAGTRDLSVPGAGTSGKYLSLKITQTGAMLGTPAGAAPP